MALSEPVPEGRLGAPGPSAERPAGDDLGAPRAQETAPPASGNSSPAKAGGGKLGSGKQAIQMLTDRVLVQVPRSEGERKSKAGILIPATAEVPRRLTWAEVVATGPHVRAIKPGDHVLFNPEDRFEVEVQGENYLILRERDIHAVAAERVSDSTGLYL
jgi:chaperonin GroES